jgi:hypothetical protein
MGVSRIHHDGHIFQKPMESMESMDIIYDIFSYHCWLVVFRHPSEQKKKSVDSQYMENKCSKPPTRLDIIFQPFHQTGVRDGKLAPRAPATSRSTRVSTLDALDGIEATCFVEDNTERMTICIVLMGFPCYSRYNL